MLSKPKFWQTEGILAHIFLPFSVLYFVFLRIKSKLKKTKKLNAKIICVGNAVVGGAGKTPSAIKIAQIIKQKLPESKIAFISKGYKGTQISPLLVDLKKHSPKQVGDEPLLLAKIAACFVGKSRIKTCEYAIEMGYEFLILDDGMQDYTIAKDYSFLIVDGGYGLGNYFPIPAGPLRDRIDFAAPNISAAIIVGADEKNVKDYLLRKIKADLKIISAEFISVQKPNQNNKYIAFAGIGRPEKFFKTLQSNGFNLLYKLSFSDHYFYSKKDEQNLLEKAKKDGATLVTTQKDYVKLSEEFQKNVEVLEVNLLLEEQIIKDILFK